MFILLGRSMETMLRSKPCVKCIIVQFTYTPTRQVSLWNFDGCESVIVYVLFNNINYGCRTYQYLSWKLQHWHATNTIELSSWESLQLPCWSTALDNWCWAWVQQSSWSKYHAYCCIICSQFSSCVVILTFYTLMKHQEFRFICQT